MIKPSALGDVIQTLPLLAALRRRWPMAKISWVINDGFAPLLSDHPDLHAIIPFHRNARAWQKVKTSWQLARQLRAEKFDLTLDLQGLLRSGLMTWATRAPRRVGFANARECATMAYTDTITTDWKNISAVDRYQEMAKALGCPSAPLPPVVPITNADRAWAREKIRDLPRPLLVLHPGAQWLTKQWRPSHFADMAQRAYEQHGTGLLLVGGPGEADICKTIIADLKCPVLSVAEQTSLKQLAAIIESGDVFLSGDSGPMHLAAAVGTPVVAVFTCTSPVRAGPYGQSHRVVETGVDCAGSYIKKCESMICMDELTPEKVWPALHAALSEVRSGRIPLSG